MQGPPTSAAAWKLAGISYAAYASICATLARRALKEPGKSAAIRLRDSPKMIVEKWQTGKVVDCT